ncbi:host attachment protein [Rhodoplanes elegans]|uniref:host attachment protein n=1 Tax=Rhodoplanes elegans TaxID=29408 RepID=UPI00308414C2
MYGALWHRPTGTNSKEHRFAKRVAAAVESLIREHKARALVIVAPPRTLADLRAAFHPDVRGRIIAEIEKDLTKCPIYEIEKHLE